MIHRAVLLLLVFAAGSAHADGKGFSFARAGQDLFSVSLGRSGAISFTEVRKGKRSRGAVKSARSVSGNQFLRGASLVPMTKALLSRGTPYVFFVDRKTRVLSLAVRKSGRWLIEKIGIAKKAANQFAVSPCGSKLCASFYDMDSGQVFVAEGSSRKWKVTAVPGSRGGVVTALARAPRGDLHVLQHDPESGEVRLALRRNSGPS